MRNLYLLLPFLLFACRTQPAQILSRQLQARVDSLRTATDLAGISVALVLEDGSTASISSGFADRESQTALKTSDRFLLGSVGKTYVSALILEEVKAGKITLDDSVHSYFSGLAWYDSLANSHEITIRNLLNHTSGLPRWVFRPEVWKSMAEDNNKIWSHQDRFAVIAGVPALHPAGKGWAYSDTNYLLLGMILEQLNGKTFYALVAERILVPYGLLDTQPSDKRELPGLVAGYTGPENPFFFPVKTAENGVYAVNPQFEWTGGGFLCTPTDLATWAHKLYGRDFLDPTQMELLLTVAPYETPLPGKAKYGLGVMVRESSLGPNYGHEGFMPGFQTVVLYYPKHKFSICLMVNEDQLSGKHPGPLYDWTHLLAEQAATIIR